MLASRQPVVLHGSRKPVLQAKALNGFLLSAIHSWVIEPEPGKENL